MPTRVDSGDVLTQLLAIVEYLEETHPLPLLLPEKAADRAFVGSVALQVACEIHPLDNLRVLKYLKHEMKMPEETKNAWYRHWVERASRRWKSVWRATARRQADVRRHAERHRFVHRATGVQCAALQYRLVALSDHPAHRG